MNTELKKKIDFAIKLIQSASKMAQEHGQPIEVCYSGGKDSDVILELTKMADVPYRAIYKDTSIDPPYTKQHCKENGVEIMKPKKTFLQCIKDGGYPSRFRRHCCSVLKEYKILDYAILGIRKSESTKRAKLYKEPEYCRMYSKKEKCRQYLPILEWTDNDIVEFIRERNIHCHPLYYIDGKFNINQRLGCLCCPLASKRKRIEQFKQYPNMVKLYIKGGGEWFKKNHEQSTIFRIMEDEYQWFVGSVFYTDLTVDELKERFKPDIFGVKPNCKQFLEDYFHINF